MSVRRTTNAPLRDRNTFGVSAQAGVLIETDNLDDLPALFADEFADVRDLLVLGGGSNLLIVDGPDIALHLCNDTIRVIEDRAGLAIVRADAGVVWHHFVMWSVAQAYAGLENLALIPGTVGAAPIQNIGAYGVEVGERIHAVEVFERATGKFHRFTAADCCFAYRDSLFKHHPDRYLVVAVEFALPIVTNPNHYAAQIDYAGLREALAASGVDADRATPRDIANAVIRLRQSKLPDPAVTGNAGSFFKNPIVPTAQANALQAEHHDMPIFRGRDDGTRKLSAAWLIERSGLKGYREGDAGVSDRHALVLVNHGGADGAQLLRLAHHVADTVQTRFDVAIEPEPRIVGATWSR